MHFVFLSLLKNNGTIFIPLLLMWPKLLAKSYERIDLQHSSPQWVDEMLIVPPLWHPLLPLLLRENKQVSFETQVDKEFL